MIKESESTFLRSPHDKENPYAQINRDLIRDETLSPECRWLLIFLLSHDNKWVIKISYIIKHLKGHAGYGRDNVYKLVEEAIKSGYMKRETFVENNLTRYRYYISESSSFSNNFSDFLKPRILEPSILETSTLTNKQSSSYEEEKKEQYKKGRESAPISAEAESLSDFFLSKIRERNPKFKEPNKVKWAKEMDLMLRLEKRDPEEMRMVIEWISTDQFWKGVCLSPSKLRDKYDQLVMQAQGNDEKELVRQNRNYAIKLKEKHPEQMKGLTFDSKFAMNRSFGKEIPFTLPHETFKEALISLFGGTYVR